jgi:hypothetical protein
LAGKSDTKRADGSSSSFHALRAILSRARSGTRHAERCNGLLVRNTATRRCPQQHQDLKPSGRSRGVRDQFCDDVVDLLGGRAQRQQSAKRLKVAAPRGAGEALPGPGVAASHGQTTLFQPSFAAWPVTRRIKSRLPKIAPKNRSNADEMAEKLERVKGIEPSSKAWEADQGTRDSKHLRDSLLNMHDFDLPLSPLISRRLLRLVSHFVTSANARSYLAEDVYLLRPVGILNAS